MPSDLLTRVRSADAPDNVLTETQAHELQRGVKAAIENSDHKRGPGLPTDRLNGSRWDHAGVGVSVYIHPSGVVILTSDEQTLVTDVSTLDHMSLATSKFHATTGGITRINDEYPDDYPEKSPEVTDQ